MSEHALEIQNLDANIDGFFLKDINLCIPKGSVMALVGRNGAGKTTLMNAIFDNYRITNGKVLFYDQEITKHREQILQETAFISDYPLYQVSSRIKNVKKMMVKIYDGFNVEQFDTYCKESKIDQKQQIVKFSYGQAKLLQLYLALSRNVKFLVLDEPMANLDPVTRMEMIEKLANFMLDEEHAIFISSHLLTDLHKIADYVTLLHEGAICMQAGMDDVAQLYYEIRATKEQMDKLPLEIVLYQQVHKEHHQALCLQEHKEILDRYDIAYHYADLEMIMYYMCKGEEHE